MKFLRKTNYNKLKFKGLLKNIYIYFYTMENHNCKHLKEFQIIY